MLNLSLLGTRRVPFVMASELNECGLACLAAIVEYFRGEHDMADIRRLAMHSGRGETLLHIRDLAERIGLAARGVRVPLTGLAALPKPAILHWEMNHFVVLERITSRGLVIMDPAAGRVEVPWSEADKAFTGVALEAQPKAGWRRRQGRPGKVSVLSFIGPLARWRTDITLIVCLSLLMEVLVLVAPFQVQMSIDHAVQAGDGRLAWVLGAAFGLVVLIQASVSLIRAWAAAVFGTRVGFDLMDRFVRALHRKTARFFLKHHTADILSRGRSVDTIQTIVTAQLIQALMDAVTSLAMVVVMFIVVPVLCLAVTAFGLLSLAVTAALRHAAIENSRRALRVAAKADSLFLENARAARAIKLFGKEGVRTSVWRNRFIELTNLHLTDSRLMMFSTQAAQVTSGLSNVALISVGTYMVIGGSITLGTMMMFFVFRAFFVERLNNCVNYMMDLRRVQTHAERIEEVLSDEDGVSNGDEPAPFVLPAGAAVRIEVRDVWFRYGNDSPWILQGANLTVAPGESVAITGASGCGKSTLMGIMLGLLEPSRGEVLINGRNLATMSSADYARLIGVVLQDDMIFHGTVADNISFFDAPVDMGRVVQAAEKANIAADIAALPMQYYSLLAEAAMDLSGGQKQRLLIARAIYHDPRILFLDEATSHLDTVSEGLVSQAVRSMQMTRVLIAHRKETIATADRVVVLSNATGTVVEAGAAATESEDLCRQE
jgi:ATP-binding cassette subfamily B protein RaxB